MKNFNVSQLVIGNTYWILEELIVHQFIQCDSIIKSHIVFGKKQFDSLKLCKYKNNFKQKKYNTNNLIKEYQEFLNHVYCFYFNEKKTYNIEWFDLNTSVFETVDDYLIMVVKEKNFREEKYGGKFIVTFDDFVTKQIKESQEKYPEKWIFCL